ncbi:helicase [Propionibacterium freudenreichii]|nr:helicase [Propionibacterium freudenreichii]
MVRVDFNRLGAKAVRSARTLTEPRALFSALPDKATGLDYLRGPQDQVLYEWNKRRDERDLVIKMNTGGGKTLVGLLVARSWLNEGVCPVAYLVPDHFLAAQVREEAVRLGIETTDNPRSSQYARGDAVLVDVFTTLFNGQSVFGVRGSTGRVAACEIGGLIIDDAHACLRQADDVFRLRVGAKTDEYDSLMKLFEDDIKDQSANAYMDLEAGRSSTLQQIPHWAWRSKADQVLGILNPVSKSDKFKWAWPLVVDELPQCTAVITADSFEIQPPVHPVGLLTGFDQAQRRLYLTATLADDSVLVRDFAADPETIGSPIVPASAGDIGDRLIVLPQQLLPSLDEASARDFVAGLALDRNVVVIVPSRARAQWWADYARLTLDKSNINDGVEHLRADPRFGLVVLVNRYDGIDLPGDACHVLVLDGLPEAFDGIEKLGQVQMSGSTALLARQVQRLEQGMGRATRSNEDYAVVILLGARLSERLDARGARDLFSPATRAQLDLAYQVADELEVSELKDLREVIDQCLGRDRDWIAYSKGVLAELSYSAPVIAPSAVLERQAFEAASRGDFAEAAAEISEAVARTAEPGFQSVLKQQLSVYTQPFDAPKAQQIQRAANKMNRSLLRPLGGVTYSRAQTPGKQQGKQASEWLSNRYETGDELLVGVNALLVDLDWSSRTSEFEQALCDLAGHLGFAGERPERDTSRGPDDLWVLTDGKYLIIEAKSGAQDSHPVYKNDAKQLSNAMDWFRAEYPRASGVPVLVHPRPEFDKHAAVPTDCRVVTTKKLASLRESVNRFSTSLAHDEAFHDPKKVLKLLDSCHLRGDDIIRRYTERGLQL